MQIADVLGLKQQMENLDLEVMDAKKKLWMSSWRNRGNISRFLQDNEEKLKE